MCCIVLISITLEVRMKPVLKLFLFSFLISLGQARGDSFIHEEETFESHHELETLKSPEMIGKFQSAGEKKASDGANLTGKNWTYVGEECCNFSTTPTCLRKGGNCVPLNETCNGDVFFGKKYCVISKLKSCKCCAPIDCRRETLDPCKKLNGTCIGANEMCNGRSVSGKQFCRKEKTCKCCFPKDCPCGGCRGYTGSHPRVKWYTGHCVNTCDLGSIPLKGHKCNQTGAADCKCCASTKCDPNTCTYNNQTGRCLREYSPNTVRVGAQECKDGCQCYLKCSKQCHVNATCILPNCGTVHICKCNVGFAGDGELCGPDKDLDGFPDVKLNCSDAHCRKDNCPTKPNSGQEDVDSNGIGDACDRTTVTTSAVPNRKIFLNNNTRILITLGKLPQPVTKDSSDSDRDGIKNSVDNCPDVPNMDQANSDGDTLGDACDNCPSVTNAGQEDKDQDLVGDACDNDNDRDRDGIQDNIDNCPDIPNADQLNSDDDDKGNSCDNDADNDGVLNWQDNCWLVYNPSQRNTDPCLNDTDDDGIDNCLDNCPNNFMIAQTDFRTFQNVDLDPSNSSKQPDPNWVIRNDGAEIIQTLNSDPGLFFGKDVLDGVDFEGTFYIDTTSDDDYAGFIFSYQNNAKFYMMQWKKRYQRYWETTPFVAIGEPAITLKRVNSSTGPGPVLRNALWHNDSVADQTELLWKDPRNIGWESHVAYRWQLLHRPQIGLIRMRILEGAMLVADSGNIFDNEIKGGRLGAFVFSQKDVIWSDLGYRCNEDVPQDSYDNLPADLQKKIEIDHSWKWW